MQMRRPPSQLADKLFPTLSLPENSNLGFITRVLPESTKDGAAEESGWCVSELKMWELFGCGGSQCYVYVFQNTYLGELIRTRPRQSTYIDPISHYGVGKQD
jgi:hypothetical protein